MPAVALSASDADAAGLDDAAQRILKNAD